MIFLKNHALLTPFPMSGVTITNMASAGVGVKDVRPYFISEIIFMFWGFLK